jgi:hypothetical protein
MNPSKSELALLMVWRGNEIEVRQTERNQTLVDVSSVLAHLSDPSADLKLLRECCLREFAKTASTLPDEQASIKTKIAYYQKLWNVDMQGFDKPKQNNK